MSEIAAQLPPRLSDAAASVSTSAATEAAKVVWQWRREPGADGRATAAAAARQKGAIGGLVGLLAAATLYVWFDKPRAAAIVVAIAVFTTLLALVSPLGAFARVMGALQAFGRGVGLVMTWLLIGLAYYLLFLPVGLLLRTTGKLRITRGKDAARASYWQAAQAAPAGLDAYRKPF